MVTKKKTSWNKDIEVGQREAFTRYNLMKIIKKQLSEQAFRDAALFMIAIDTLTSVNALSAVQKKDVFERNGAVRQVITIDERKTVLSSATTALLAKHFSHLKPDDFLFSGVRSNRRTHISPRQISRIVKNWCKRIGIDPTNYGTESLRRTGALHFYERTRDLNAVRVLLDHNLITSTIAYLGLEDRAENINNVLAKRRVYEVFNEKDVVI